MKGMTADQHASDGRHNVTGSRHRSMAAGAGAGLSIVVPVYNEAAGLAQLHGPGSAESPPPCATSAGLPAKSWTTAVPTRHSMWHTACRPTSRMFRDGIAVASKS